MKFFILVFFSLHGHEEKLCKVRKSKKIRKTPPHNLRVDRDADFNVRIVFTELLSS